MINDWNQQMPVFVGGILLGIMISGMIAGISMGTGLVDWIYLHENLSAGLIAVTAGVITSLILIWQIRQQYGFRKDALNRRLIAAKSTLPLALSDFTEYANECWLLSIRLAKGEEFTPLIPTIEDTHIEVFRECIEFADPENQEKLASLLRLYQLQRSRLRGAIDRYRPQPTRTQPEADRRAARLGGYLSSSAVLILDLNELWAFARNNSSDEVLVPISDRIDNMFTFNSDEIPENWPMFITHLQRSMDREAET